MRTAIKGIESVLFGVFSTESKAIRFCRESKIELGHIDGKWTDTGLPVEYDNELIEMEVDEPFLVDDKEMPSPLRIVK